MDYGVGINYLLTALSMHGRDAQGAKPAIHRIKLPCVGMHRHAVIEADGKKFSYIIALIPQVTAHFTYETVCLFLEQFAYWISRNLCTYAVIKCTARIARSL